MLSHKCFEYYIYLNMCTNRKKTKQKKTTTKTNNNNYLYNAAFPAVYGQFPQALPPPLAAVAPTQREGKQFLNVIVFFIDVSVSFFLL